MKPSNNQSLNMQDSGENKLCKIHKRNIEFQCFNDKCKFFNQRGCSKCLLQGQIHENCELITQENNEKNSQYSKRRSTIFEFDSQMNIFMKEVNSYLIKIKDLILKQIQLGDEQAFEKAQHYIELLKDVNYSNSQQKNQQLSDVFFQLEENQEYLEDDYQLSNSKSKPASQSQSKSDISILDQSQISQNLDVSSISVASNNSVRKKVLLNSNRRPNQNEQLGTSEINSSSSQIISSFNQSSSFVADKIQPKQSQAEVQSKQVSLGDFKYKQTQKIQITSDYIEDFCLFETSQIQDMNNSQHIMRDFESNLIQKSKAQKQYYLLTRCERQALQVFNLQKMRLERRIHFTNDNEIIQFKQISDSEVVIFSPNNRFFQVQSIFEEDKFQQVDFKFSIDCIECDKEEQIIFIGHQLGKISVWDMKKQQMIIESNKIHSKKISFMDYSQGRLITCCESGSVKEFIFSQRNPPELRQKYIYRKEILSDQELESITCIKIINEETILVQLGDEFIEIYKNGQKVNEECLEFMACLQNMKVYEKRYCIMQNIEKENTFQIFDFNNFSFIRRPIQLQIKDSEDSEVIGAYYVNNSIIFLLLNEKIIKYF
ncbi:hypothetical protein ABPG72_006413 [Tetrahymena utriculariae]